jgi:hypothetical protein
MIKKLIYKFPFFTATQLAHVTGKVISLSPVIGNLTRLMTRYCYLTIESRTSWDKLLLILHSHEVLKELKFWLDNVHKVNKKVHFVKTFILYFYTVCPASHITCIRIYNHR